MSPASTSNNPRYTCNESDLPVFLPQLHKYITACNPKYVALAKRRYVTTGRYTCTTSLNHIDRILDGSFIEGTLFKPSTVKPQSLVDLAPIKGAVTPAKNGPSMTKGDSSDSSYTVNNATITDLDLALLTDILNCYDDEETREEDEATANGSGTALLLLLSSRRKVIATKTQNYGASIDAAYDSLIKEGITSPRVTAFNSLKSAASKLRKQLVGTDYEVSDAKYSAHLCAAVRNLGPFVTNKIDLQIKIDKARGDPCTRRPKHDERRAFRFIIHRQQCYDN